MPANTAPIFTISGDLSSDSAAAIPAVMTALAGDFTGVAAGYVLLHTAGPNGSFVDNLRFKARGANVASGVRVFLNNGGPVANAANNYFYDDEALPVTAVSTTGKTGPVVVMPMKLMMSAGWKIYSGLNVAVASGWGGMAVAGEY